MPRLNGIEVEETPCPLCGSADRAETLLVRDHEYTSTPQGDFPLVCCAACGLWYLSPRPTLDSMGAVYPADYLNYHTADDANRPGFLGDLKRRLSVRAISTKLQTARWKRLLETHTRLRSTDAPRVLDVGCGDGWCLDLIKKAIPRARTVGIEFDAGAAARAAERHEVHVGPFEAVTPIGKFDLIVSSHVIEHVVDPVAFTRKIASLLAPGGVAIIDTPNVDTLLFHRFGRDWGGVHAPRHLTLLSADTMRRVAKRSGLEITSLEYLPINTFWVWTMHSRLHDRAPALADALFHPQKCLAGASPYYLALMTLFETFERVGARWDPKLGQMRVVLRHAPS